MFENIAGYDNIKKELSELVELFQRSKSSTTKNTHLPRGVLFYGEPGNGKTLFTHEFLAALQAPVFTIKAGEENLHTTIQKAFNQAREKPFAVVLAEEIDLLFQKDDKTFQRIFQEEMDGYNKDTHFLVVATTNHVNCLPDPLLRSGRFDRQIAIGFPEGENLINLFDFYLKRVGVTHFDCRYLGEITHGISCADVQAVVNNAYWIKGAALSLEDLDEAFRRLPQHTYEPYYPDETIPHPLSVAIHEAGHAILVDHFSKDFVFYRASYGMTGLEGTTRYFFRKDRPNSSEREYNDAIISLGGYAANRIIEGFTPNGAENDLDEARHVFAHLVNRTGFCGVTRVLPAPRNGRQETERRRYHNEILARLLFHKAWRQTRSFIKHHQPEIMALAERMQKQGFIDAKDLASILGKSDTEVRAEGGQLQAAFSKEEPHD